MARTLTTGNSVDDASQFTTAAITPSAKALVLIFVTNTRPIFAFGTLATPRIAGNGLSWEMVNTVTTEDGDRRLTCFRSMGAAPTNGPLTIDFADQIQDLCAWSVFEYTGVDTSGVSGAEAIAQSRSATAAGTALTVTLTPSDPANNLSAGGITLELVNEATHTV